MSWLYRNLDSHLKTSRICSSSSFLKLAGGVGSDSNSGRKRLSKRRQTRVIQGSYRFQVKARVKLKEAQRSWPPWQSY